MSEIHRDARQNGLVRALETLGGREGIVQRHLATMLQLARSPRPVLDSSHFEPGHFTASAFVLSPDGTELLLILHKKLGLWLQPGGHLESTDEDYVHAARRELQEETGMTEVTLIDPLFDVDVHSIPAYGDLPAHFHHDLRVLLRAATTEVSAADDAAQAIWFPLSQIVEADRALADGRFTDDSVRRVARRVIAGFGAVGPASPSLT